MPAPPHLYRYDCDICCGSGYVQLRVHSRSLASYHFPNHMPAQISESQRSYPCPECAGQTPYELLEVLRQDSVVDTRYMREPGYVQHVKTDLAHQMAQHMLEHGYIAFEDVPVDPMSIRTRATIGVVPKKKVLPVKEQIEQLEAKLTCMCGDYVNHHSMGSGHSPVSMHDYSLSRAEEERDQLKRQVEQLKNRLEEVFP
jgi:hypothetical protein